MMLLLFQFGEWAHSGGRRNDFGQVRLGYLRVEGFAGAAPEASLNGF